MNILLEKLHYGLRWNALESISYQSLLLIHNIVLFSLIPQQLYGIIGSLFSLVYLTISITNFGFDITLPAYFSHATKNKQSFREIIIIHYVPEFFLLMALCLTFLFLPGIHANFFKHFIVHPTLAIIVCLIILSEALKKTCRIILHLSFLNKLTTMVELISIGVYLTMVWTQILWGTPITVMLFFIPMLITSCISTLIYGFYIYELYQTLPSDTSASPAINHKKIIINRLCNYSTHLSNSLFSYNLLVPLCALAYTLEMAALLKISSTILHAITSCFRSIFGSTSEAVFSYAKNNGIEEKRSILYSINNKSNIFLLTTFFMSIVFVGFLSFLNFNYNSYCMYVMVCIIALQFMEHALFIHEKFFIAEEKPWYVSFSIMSFLIMACVIILFRSQLPIFFILPMLIVTRFVSWKLMKHLANTYCQH